VLVLFVPFHRQYFLSLRRISFGIAKKELHDTHAFITLDYTTPVQAGRTARRSSSNRNSASGDAHSHQPQPQPSTPTPEPTQQSSASIPLSADDLKRLQERGEIEQTLGIVALILSCHESLIKNNNCDIAPQTKEFILAGSGRPSSQQNDASRRR
jgi:hypothetical protein